MREIWVMKFYTNAEGIEIEGFLGDMKECEILYILREPNSNGKVASRFWFKDVLNGDFSNGKRYVNVLGRLFNIIRVEENNQYSELVKKLKRCCYINLHPHFGEKNATGKYRTTLDNFKNNNGAEADNRWSVIDNLICNYGCKTIVTVPDIFNALCSDENDVTKQVLLYGDKEFRIGKYKDATVYEFYHPAYPAISYSKMDNSQIRGKL